MPPSRHSPAFGFSPPPTVWPNPTQELGVVTLEPCRHRGETPPCTDALAAAGVKRAVIACEDPDPRVTGKGFEALRAAGIDVEVGVCETEARDLNAGFFKRVTQGRPIVTLKTATTLDGRIATHSGESRWITGEVARAASHMLRATHDAILVGVQTAAEDDPDLTCRLPGLGHRSPIRIVLDPRLRLPLTHKLVATAREVPTWLVALRDADSERRRAFEECGTFAVDVWPMVSISCKRPTIGACKGCCWY